MNKVYTYQYEVNYDPAMPVVEIHIGRAMADVSLLLTAVVDSGADATIIPLNYLHQIQARRSRKSWMRGVTGGRMLVDLFSISLQLGPLVQTHLEVVSDVQNNEAILGRDVLNHLVVTLNGPGNSVEIIDSSV
jgi:hypothetical protein